MTRASSWRWYASIWAIRSYLLYIDFRKEQAVWCWTNSDIWFNSLMCHKWNTGVAFNLVRSCNSTHLSRFLRASTDPFVDNRPLVYSAFKVFISWAVEAARAISCCLLTWASWTVDTMILRMENTADRPGTGTRLKQWLMISMVVNARMRLGRIGGLVYSNRRRPYCHWMLNVDSYLLNPHKHRGNQEVAAEVDS